MRKNSFFRVAMLVCFSLFIQSSNLQAKDSKKDSGIKPAFDKGSKSLGLSLGLGINYNYYGNAQQMPAYNLTYDQGIIGNVGPGTIGIGGILAYKTAAYKYSNGQYKARWSNYMIGVRGTYHLTALKEKNNKFDPYAGITVGLRIYRYTDTYYNYLGYNPYNYGNVYSFQGLFVGSKYNFSKKFGAFAELGYDISFFRIGLNLNL